MKQAILPAIRLTLTCVFFTAVYTLLVWAIAQLAPGRGHGEIILVNHKVAGFKLLGQAFSTDGYFQGRPSAVGYNAAGSGGSNQGPFHPAYLQLVAARIDTLLAHNPGVRRGDIPADLVTASGSGLDPHISEQGAYVQVKRVATARGMREDVVRRLVDRHVERPLAGLWGTATVNVLELNIDLDNLTLP